MQFLNRGLTFIGVSMARPTAFVIVVLYGLAWASLGHIDWHGFATLATWIMTLLIQRAEHRDTQAIQAKLDELLKSSAGASNSLVKIDQQEPEAIAEHRSNTEPRN
jgi:low affinity Fe/Cu permease